MLSQFLKKFSSNSVCSRGISKVALLTCGASVLVGFVVDLTSVGFCLESMMVLVEVGLQVDF